jgi:hypothetical protein
MIVESMGRKQKWPTGTEAIIEKNKILMMDGKFCKTIPIG